ncbi:LOG family protein [Candidatus Peregrinibacteria bacterium]|nr:MAG: LOG family protein [Candidatus Peregrinibacteria bacterium]
MDPHTVLSIVSPVDVESELRLAHFRVVIFGSARIRRGGERYQQVYELSRKIAHHNIDIVTGGGPGIMEAANAGHHAGRNSHDSHSIGFTVNLPFEENVNKHLDYRKHFTHFSDRLDHFMAMANVIIVMPGGVGTCLELSYSWQLTQVRHMKKIPIILMGDMWEGFLRWVREYPLEKGYISPGDMENIFLVKNNSEAMNIILPEYESYQELSLEERQAFKTYRLEETKKEAPPKSDLAKGKQKVE